MQEGPEIITIAGPTATGKSEIAIKIAKYLGNAEIISADAFQIYCYLNIGTAKLPFQRRLNPLHHMIDVCLPDKSFSVAAFQTMARKCLEGAISRGKKAVITGGTPLYLIALLFDIEIPQEKEIPGLRDSLLERASADYPGLLNHLSEIDPEALNLIHPANKRRVIRAIEIFEKTGIKYSELHRRWKNRKPAYNGLNLWVYRERQELYEAIEERVDRMIEVGLVEEVKSLINRFNLSHTARQAIGYKEIIEYLEGKISLSEAVEKIKKRTRNYAKKQISWFKAENRFIPVDISGLSNDEAANKIINRFF